MSYKIPESFERTLEHLKKLPGVGSRTALRNILHMLKWKEGELSEFANSIAELERISSCRICGVYCDQGEECSVCTNNERKESKVICVVENFNDFWAIEKSGTFKGRYHVLGGVLNPLLGVGPEDLNISSLLLRAKAGDIEEVLMALNPSLEGQATCSYVFELLKDYCRVERIGFGMPMGGAFEFLDDRTISTALENRTPMQ